MKRLLALAAFALSPAAFAQDSDAGMVVDAGVVAVDAGATSGGFPNTTLGEMVKVDQAAIDADAGIVSPLPPDEAAMLREIYLGVKSGNGWMAATAFLLLFVGLLRKYGKKFHEWLDDNNPVDKYFFRFLFDTKIGAWVLNWLTAVAGGLGTAWAAGSKIDGSIIQSVVLVSTSATMLLELYKDIKEWWDARKLKKEEEAKAAAAALPTPPVPPAPGV